MQVAFAGIEPGLPVKVKVQAVWLLGGQKECSSQEGQGRKRAGVLSLPVVEVDFIVKERCTVDTSTNQNPSIICNKLLYKFARDQHLPTTIDSKVIPCKKLFILFGNLIISDACHNLP